MVGFGPADVPPSAAVKFVGAGTAGCIADLLTFPLDTAKVRLQVNVHAHKAFCALLSAHIHEEAELSELKSPPLFLILTYLHFILHRSKERPELPQLQGKGLQ